MSNPHNEKVWRICKVIHEIRGDFDTECSRCPPTVDTDYGRCVQGCRGLAEELIRECRAPVSEWIPVSERLPEDQRQVGNDTQGSGVPGRLSPSAPERVTGTTPDGRTISAATAVADLARGLAAPKPEQRWDWIDGSGLTFDGVPQDIEISTLLDAHGITPDSKPIDKEQGHRLLRLYKENPTQAVTDFMRDWISQVCGE